ncbi:F-box/LRR-repeat protein 4 [Amphibalanus amphitrite]|uniref:F-box/LRR-repeat protein 4 n=1 Tax=Amphibalanus amphitrite TaxID=1232801 RepID=A0A6A4WIL7_AMPAM|nr:F-box/LRR-repeat protein 4 [Amphibalanus amphitrite]
MEPTDWSQRLRKRTQRPTEPAGRADATPGPAKRRRTSAERRRRERHAQPQQQQQVAPSEPVVTPHINALPEEVLLYLLSHLNVPERVRVRAVCRRWRELCQLSLRSVRHINLNRYFGPLNVQCRPALTDQRFKLVLQLLPNLQKLELGPAGARLSRNGILSIGKLCPRLIDLDISCLRMSFRFLENLCRNCPRLQRINVPQFNFKEQNLEVLLKYLGELRTLELVSTGVTGDCFSLLPASVRKVTLRSCPRIREHNFCLVGDRCPQLEELCLSKTRVTSHDIKHIATRCPQLRHLDITGCNLVHPEEFLELLPNLTSLSAGACANVNKNSLRALATFCTKLERLNLRGGASYRSVPSYGLQLLHRLPQLHWLDLSYQSEVSDEVLRSLARAPRLATVLLRENYSSYSARSPFTEKGLIELAVSCRSLTSLDVSHVQGVTRHLYDSLVSALPATRRLSLVVGNTDLEGLVGTDQATAGTVVLCQGSPAALDYPHVMRDDPWSDDSESEGPDEERFADVFIDWLWLNNALWAV